MNITKVLVERCIQLVVNSGEGVVGPVIPVLDFVEFFDIDDTKGQTGMLGNDMYINFTGSSNFHNWMDNFDIRKVGWLFYPGLFKKIKVHAGVMGAYKVARQYLWNKVKEYKPKNIVITGHSLGGGLATFCAYDFKKGMPTTDITPILFASLRVGNSRFVKSFNNLFPLCYRFNYRCDIVPKLPPFFLNYRHVGNQVELCKDKYEYQLKHILKAIFGDPADHNPINYYNGVKELNWLP